VERSDNLIRWKTDGRETFFNKRRECIAKVYQQESPPNCREIVAFAQGEAEEKGPTRILMLEAQVEFLPRLSPSSLSTHGGDFSPLASD